MSIAFYEKIAGAQLQHDLSLSTLSVAPDPQRLAPGKACIPLNICDMEISGTLTLCDIFCPANFTLRALGSITETAGTSITETAGTSINLDATAGGASGDINITASDLITIAATGAGLGDIVLTNAGAGNGAVITLISDDDITLAVGQTSGTVVSSLALDTSNSTAAVLEVQVDTVTQITNQTTTVISNSVSGVITIATGTLAANASANFILSNTKIAADSLLLVSFETSVALLGVVGAYVAVTCLSLTAGAARLEIANCGANTTGAIAPGKVHYLVLNPL